LYRAADTAVRQKGSFEMFTRGTFHRQLAVFAAALLFSSIAVGTAVGPAAAGAARPLVNVTYA